MNYATVLEINGITKSFSGVQVLKNVGLTLEAGEVHAIVGENGAGKSTLIKILSGAYSRDAGAVRVGGAEIEQLTPRIAHDLGIVTIYQERNLIPHLSVGENILLGNLPVGLARAVQWKRLFTDAAAILESLHLQLDPRSIVADLGAAEQQAVEIAKALYRKVRIVIMDEPTASLTETEIRNLFALIANLRRNRVSVIYISHRLDEIFEIADRVTVLRDGEKVLTKGIGELSKAALVEAMIGEELDYTHIEQREGEAPLLEVESLTREGIFAGIQLSLRRGEIFGIAGMVGSGRTEVLRAIAGIDPVDAGRIVVEGRELQGRPLREFISHGVCFVPEDRDSSGLIVGMHLAGNTTLASLRKVTHGPFLDLAKEQSLAQSFVDQLSIAATSVMQEVRFLSGGNRQKVMLAKWLCLGVEVFVMDEPTQGVDVGAREEIHRIMKRLVKQGKGILMVSSELEELLNMTHRIAVMDQGRFVAILDTRNTSREEILKHAIGKSTQR
jgi:ABC-type sugar transport system ATPase subunit